MRGWLSEAALVTLTCQIPCRDALSCHIAGGHFSGTRVKVSQLAVEFSGVAELSTACS